MVKRGWPGGRVSMSGFIGYSAGVCTAGGGMEFRGPSAGIA